MITTVEVHIILAILGSSVLTAIINHHFMKKKSDAEVESAIIKNYETALDRLYKEVDRNTMQISLLEAKEKLYIENSNLLMKDKMDLSSRVLKLEQANRGLHEENRVLESRVASLRVELDGKQQRTV